MDSTPSSTGPAQSLKEFAQDARIGVSTLYTLPTEMQPFSVKIGKRRIVTESAADWLARIAGQGGVVKTIKPAP